MHSIYRPLPLCFLFAGVLLAAAGCGPTYPACETDKDCNAGMSCVVPTAQALDDLAKLGRPKKLCMRVRATP